MTGIIYKFYELISKDDKNGIYRCKTCVSLGKPIPTKTDKSCSLFASSNLIKHLEIHQEDYVEYVRLTDQNKTPTNKKRKIPEKSSETTHIKTPTIVNSLFKQEKFAIGGVNQRERLVYLNKMIIKCMLPISIVESSGFKEYMRYVDPSFTMPSCHTIKRTSLPYLVQKVRGKIQDILNDIDFPNVSTDGWTDATMRVYLPRD